MKKLQLQNLSHIVCSSFLVWTIYKQGVWSFNFTIKKMYTWGEPLKKLNPKQKEKLCTILNYPPPQPTYLPN